MACFSADTTGLLYSHVNRMTVNVAFAGPGAVQRDCIVIVIVHVKASRQGFFNVDMTLAAVLIQCDF